MLVVAKGTLIDWSEIHRAVLGCEDEGGGVLGGGGGQEVIILSKTLTQTVS